MDEYPGLSLVARAALDRARDGLPPDLVVTVFVAHHGEGGGMAYVSTADRVDMVGAVVEWLRHLVDDPAYEEAVRTAFARWFGR